MTGVFGWRNTAQPAATQTSAWREPPLEHAPAEAPRVSVRQTAAGDETGIEIPAFLRRQSS